MVSLKRRIATIAVALCMLGAVAVLVLVVLTVRSGINRGDCGESPPFAKQRYPGQSIFLAKVLYVSGDWRPSDEHIPWSIALIERRYWGVPWWVPNLILIGHSGPFLKKGTEYFIDGDRTIARLSSFFPYIDFRCSSRTAPVSDAEMDLRVLRDGPPKSGVRIIGRTIRRFGVGDWRPAGGVTVRITGPTAQPPRSPTSMEFTTSSHCRLAITRFVLIRRTTLILLTVSTMSTERAI
jgi:hypothetical protein